MPEGLNRICCRPAMGFKGSDGGLFFAGVEMVRDATKENAAALLGAAASIR